ncbi:MAG: ATP-binding protein [Chloroflexota bacterium]
MGQEVLGAEKKQNAREGENEASRRPAVPSRIARLHPTDARAALRSLVVAGALIGATVAAKYVLYQLTGANAGFTIYVPAVAIAAWYRGLLGGVLATVLSALVDTLVFLPPLAVVLVDLRDQQLRLVAYLAGGIAVSYLSHRLRTERDRARTQSTETNKALEEAAAAREELGRMVEVERRANELRDAFNSIISHELRTPITLIYGGAKLLANRERRLDEQTRTDLIDDLEAEADRLYRLVEDLLVLSKSERGAVERATEPLLLPRIAARVVRSEQERWPAVRFTVHSGNSVSPARGEETYVEQVLRNLLSNAAKYGPHASAVQVMVDETTEGVRVRVLDEGAGIDMAETARLFELYYRSLSTAGTISGAGIGLYVCRVLVDAMGGRIWAAARPEGGSEFGFILERDEEDKA